MSRANDLVGWLLLTLVVLSPIPFGGNPAIFWAIAGLLFGALLLGYLVFVVLSKRELRVPISKFTPVLLPGLVLCVWLAVQALPLAGFVGGAVFTGLAGQEFGSRTLSLAPGSTWFMLIRMMTYGVIFFLAAQVGASDQRRLRLLSVLFWAIAAHAAFALVQLTQLGDTILGFEKTAYLGAATGTFINRNSFATFLAMGLTLGAALLSDRLLTDRPRNQTRSDVFAGVAITAGGMFVILVTLLATQSRMGFFAGMVGVGLVILLSTRWMPKAGAIFPVLLAALFFGGIAAAWFFGQSLLERVIGLEGATVDRFNIFGEVLVMITERPWLGYGGGAFELAFPMFYGPPLSPTVLIDKAHSTYLTLAAEIGLVGAMLPILMLLYLFGRAATAYLRNKERLLPGLATMALLAVVAVHSTVDFSLEIQANTIVLMMALGLSFAGSRRMDHPPSN